MKDFLKGAFKDFELAVDEAGSARIPSQACGLVQ